MDWLWYLHICHLIYYFDFDLNHLFSFSLFFHINIWLFFIWLCHCNNRYILKSLSILILLSSLLLLLFELNHHQNILKSLRCCTYSVDYCSILKNIRSHCKLLWLGKKLWNLKLERLKNSLKISSFLGSFEDRWCIPYQCWCIRQDKPLQVDFQRQIEWKWWKALRFPYD